MRGSAWQGQRARGGVRGGPKIIWSVYCDDDVTATTRGGEASTGRIRSTANCAGAGRGAADTRAGP